MSGSTVGDGQRRLRLLSLDGGGVRGLSSIIILKHIMKGISAARGRPVEPWEEFDIIGGTSTGGLIAIMLGRLRMSLDECQAAYLRLSQRIFNPKSHYTNLPGHAKTQCLTDGRFDSKELEDAIKDTIRHRELPENELLKEPDSPCKVFVCAVSTSNSEAAILRSYENSEWPMLLYDECKIWEACRATSATTAFFDPITIGPLDQKFADGAVMYNNPIQVVHREARSIWPDRSADAILVSIGTGSAPGMAFEGDIMKIVHTMRSIVTQSERTHNDFYSNHGSMVDQDLLFRFNVFHGLAEVGLEEYKEKARMADATHAYLGNGEIRKKVKTCIGQISLLQLEGSESLQTQASLVPLTALHDACPEADLDKISSLLEARADINALDSRGFTPLMIACENDNMGLVEFLLSKGADTKKDYSMEHSPMSLAIANSSTEIVRLLIDNGVPVDRRTKFRVVIGIQTADIHGTPLGQATCKGHESLVELILKRGADVNAKQGVLGWTPLHYAVYNRHEAVIRLLLQYKARIDVIDARGKTPLVPTGYTGSSSSKEGDDWFARLKTLIVDWTSRGMYSEAAALLAQPRNVLAKSVNTAVLKHANAAAGFPPLAQTARELNLQLPRSQSTTTTLGTPNPHPAAYPLRHPPPQHVHQQPATGNLSYFNTQPIHQQPPPGNFGYPTSPPIHQQPPPGNLRYPTPQPLHQQPAPGDLRYQTPQPVRQQSAPGNLSYPNTQPIYELPANGRPRATNPQPTAMTNNMPNKQMESNEAGRLGRWTKKLLR